MIKILIWLNISLRSLEHTDSDTKKKLETAEREFDTLNTKICDLSSEIENLTDENKRLNLKLVKRLPLSNAESTYIEKNVLEDKLKRTEKKLKEATDKIKNKSNGGSDSSANAEKDSKINELQVKIDDLQKMCDTLTAEANEIKNMVISTDHVPKKAKDTTPKSTLLKWVSELDEECGKLSFLKYFYNQISFNLILFLFFKHFIISSFI